MSENIQQSKSCQQHRYVLSIQHTFQMIWIFNPAIREDTPCFHHSRSGIEKIGVHRSFTRRPDGQAERGERSVACTSVRAQNIEVCCWLRCACEQTVAGPGECHASLQNATSEQCVRFACTVLLTSIHCGKSNSNTKPIWKWATSSMAARSSCPPGHDFAKFVAPCACSRLLPTQPG